MLNFSVCSFFDEFLHTLIQYIYIYTHTLIIYLFLGAWLVFLSFLLQGSCFNSEERLSLQINLSARGDRPADLDKLKPYVIEHILFLLVSPTAVGLCLWTLVPVLRLSHCENVTVTLSHTESQQYKLSKYKLWLFTWSNDGAQSNRKFKRLKCWFTFILMLNVDWTKFFFFLLSFEWLFSFK